jgi:hypothetical protein
MTEVLEKIAITINVEEGWECPFAHKPVTYPRKTVLPPPPEINNADTLSNNLETESMRAVEVDITFDADGATHAARARYTAHHLLPGNESWAVGNNQLRKWVEKKKAEHIKGDIGYGVNHYTNGVDLPGNKPISEWGKKTSEYKRAFAFAAMKENAIRQFHDRHPAYSDFVINLMNKIAAKLQGMEPDMGCGEDDCPGAMGGPPYEPPYKLVTRLNACAARLAGHVMGPPQEWRKPLITSRFALMYKDQTLSEDKARAILQVDNFTYV